MKDRTVIPLETLTFLGHPHLMSTANIRRAIPDWPEKGWKLSAQKKPSPKGKAKAAATSSRQEDVATGPASKKRPRKQPTVRRTHPNTLVANLGGNGMCLPDLACVMYSLQLSSTCPQWTHGPPSLARVIEIMGAGQSSTIDDAQVRLDHTLPASEIRNIYGEDDGNVLEDGDSSDGGVVPWE